MKHHENSKKQMNQIAQQTTKADVWWNMVGSIISAAASFLLLLFVTRFAGAAEGGIFSLAYSTAQILLTLGKFGVRSFQATDIKNEISFRTYRNTRIFFCLGMMLLDFVYVLISGYNERKSLIFLFVCLMKMTDAVEDVYHGQLQKVGRLALAGKLLAARNLFTIILFGISMWFYRELLFASRFTALISLVLCLALNIGFSRKAFTRKEKGIDKETAYLFKSCFPLFLGTFLSLVIYNVPKYVIDFFGDESQTAYYTIIFMPTFVINLFSDFIFKPMLTDMAYEYENRQMKSLSKRIHKLLGGIGLLMIFAIVCAYVIGTQILSWFYAVDVNAFRFELCVLMLGGGFSAAVYLLYNVLTCMRKQGCILFGYGMATVIILISAILLFRPLGILGETLAYLGTEMILTMFMYCSAIYYIRKERQV